MALLAVIPLLAFTLPASRPLQRYEISGFAQGTTYHIVYYAADAVVSKKQVDDELKSIDRSVSLYMPTSLICRFNGSVKGITIDEPFRVLVKKAFEVNKATDGAVDVTVKPLVDAWGADVKKSGRLPDSAQIKAVLAHVGMDKIRLEGNFLRKLDPKVQIDLNGIAQGYTADLLGRLLRSKKVSSYMAEIGGELRVKGTKPDGKPFSIGVEGISGNDLMPEPFRKVIGLTDGAVTTSGNYRKYVEAGGKKLSHIIDPRTGHPADNEMISVTVIAKDGITADGIDNGFMVLGLNRTLTWIANRTDMGAYIVYRKPDGTVADTATQVFTKYLYTDQHE